MRTSTVLPKWLDSHIFGVLGATISPVKGNMTVIDWGKDDMPSYLGTYFPRSYAESYCIFSHYFSNNISEWRHRREISILGFGCGTGGDIFGLLMAIAENLGSVRRVHMHALDGNRHCLRLYEELLDIMRVRMPFDIDSREGFIAIDDNYDLGVTSYVIDGRFDIALSFKAIGEFATRNCFGKDNPYRNIATQLYGKLNDGGIMLIADITSFCNAQGEWFPDMLDRGLADAGCRVVDGNKGHNQQFHVSHSRADNYTTKIAWRIIRK